MLLKMTERWKSKIALRRWYVCRFLASFAYQKGFVSLFRHGRLSMMADHDRILYDAVNIDINNICNLRCRFCFNTFEDRHYHMTREMYESVLPIIPLVRDITPEGTGVYLSCLYEPTLSRDFFDFLDMLPPEGRRKVFFTSNFSRTLEEEQIRRMLRANLHHINISIETLREERYREICSSVHFDSFMGNLQLLARLYPEAAEPKPQLRFITMVLNCNRDEIIPIMKFCSEELHAYEHELRTPFISTYENMEWNRGQLMNAEECRSFEAELKALAIRYVASIHPRAELVTVEDAERESVREAEPVKTESSQGQPNERRARTDSELEELRICREREFLFMRISASGVCSMNITGETFPLPDSRDPAAFYGDILLRQYRRRASGFVWTAAPAEKRVRRIGMKVRLEELKANEVYITLRGICRVRSAVLDPYMLTVSAVDGNGRASRFFTAERAERTEGGHAIRFETYLDRRLLQTSPVRLTFYLTARETLEDERRYRYPYEIYWH